MAVLPWVHTYLHFLDEDIRIEHWRPRSVRKPDLVVAVSEHTVPWWELPAQEPFAVAGDRRDAVRRNLFVVDVHPKPTQVRQVTRFEAYTRIGFFQVLVQAACHSLALYRPSPHEELQEPVFSEQRRSNRVPCSRAISLAFAPGGGSQAAGASGARTPSRS